MGTNRKRYDSPTTKFIELDITRDQLPSADLWICRDVLFHLSNEDVFLTLRSFISSDIRYALLTSHTTCSSNKNILTGSFRALNLELPPFNLCRPIKSIADCIEGHHSRSLCLWEREKLVRALGTRGRVKLGLNG